MEAISYSDEKKLFFDGEVTFDKIASEIVCENEDAIFPDFKYNNVKLLCEAGRLHQFPIEMKGDLKNGQLSFKYLFEALKKVYSSPIPNLKLWQEVKKGNECQGYTVPAFKNKKPLVEYDMDHDFFLEGLFVQKLENNTLFVEMIIGS